jgi:hypothetical protein
MQTFSSDHFLHPLIEDLAYQFWEERGRPSGSSENDWFRAERQLHHHLGLSSPDQSDWPIELPFLSIVMGPAER